MASASWSESLPAFIAAADAFAAALPPGDTDWRRHALGGWTVRDLVGHTTQGVGMLGAALTRPARKMTVDSAAGYFVAVRAMDPQVIAASGRRAGSELGADPSAAVDAVLRRVASSVTTHDGDELVATAVGGMRLADYLVTRTFELCVHTADLAAALGAEAHLPSAAAAQSLQVICELAIAGGRDGHLLRATTGRTGLPAGFTVL